MIPIHVSTTRIDGAPVSINCPACGAKGVPSASFSNKESANVILRHTTHWVTCGACGETLYSKVHIHDLVGQTPERLEDWVVRRTGLPANFLWVLALVMFYLPLLGPILSFASWMANLRRPKVAKWSMILFLVGGLWTVVVILTSPDW